MSLINKLTKSAKQEPKIIPAGATILKKEKNVEVEEIENGFLVIERYEIEYQIEDDRDWTWEVKKYYSKEDPITFNNKNKDLADVFK